MEIPAQKPAAKKAGKKPASKAVAEDDVLGLYRVLGNWMSLLISSILISGKRLYVWTGSRSRISSSRNESSTVTAQLIDKCLLFKTYICPFYGCGFVTSVISEGRPDSEIGEVVGRVMDFEKNELSKVRSFCI